MDDLRDKLDNMLNKETADSLNQWLNNKRDMNDEQITQSKITHVIKYVESLMHKLTDEELDELINELVHLYERYNVYVQSRNDDKPE